MLKLYDFNRLIEKYSTNFMIISNSDGQYVDGVYQKGAESQTPAKGAVVPFSERKIYQSGGTYTAKDRQLYMRTAIEKPFNNKQVIYKGNTYNLEEDTDWEEYADAHVYVMKYVSRFGG